jgi:ribosomal protein S18 acetylase RimI-like enzyme
MTDIVVRPAVRADQARLGVLGAALVRAHHDWDPARFFAAGPRTADGYGSFLASRLDDPDALVLVAEHEGEVVGYAYAALEGGDYMSLRGPAGVVHDLVVAPEHRRGGVGRRLLEAAIADLRGRGAPQVVLSTAERNHAAQRLFARLGFRRTMIEMTLDEGGAAYE